MNLITALGAHCLFDNNLEAFNINPNSRKYCSIFSL